MSISFLRVALLVVLFGISTKGLAAAPVVTTVAASGITSSSAVLNGVGTPSGEATTGRFRYSDTSPGTCNDTFGTRVPAASGTDLGSGSSAVPYSITTTGLTPGVTYYFCAIVTNASGTAFGSVLSFTIPYKPVVVTSGTINLTSSSATLQGAATPVAAVTTAWFRYSTTSPGVCDDSFGTRAPSSSGTSVGSGITSVPYSQSVSGLVPGATYYYCAIANNSYGTGFGAVLSFTTPAMAPTVTTSSATNLTRTAGKLNGYANPGGDPTTGWFRYGTMSPGTCNDSFGSRAPGSGGTALGAGTSNASFSQSVTGLSPGVTYYYCALAENSLGTSWGSVQTFITPSAPTAFTMAPSSITNTSATLNGTGNPTRAASTGWFRYTTNKRTTCDDKFGSRAPLSGGTALGSDIYDQPYSQSIAGLSPATTYYYCAIVSNTEGTAYGTIQSFTTATVPTATTSVPTSVTSTSAAFSGAGVPNGSSATGWFRYSTTSPGSCNDSFGTRAPSSTGIALGSGSTSTSFGQSVSGLLPGVTYYYCAIVSNSYGTRFGSVVSFTTPAMSPTVTTSSVTNLTRTTGVLTGYGNPGGDATTGWFRYSTASPGTCNDSFGTRAPATGGSALGAGTSNASFSQAITGLAPATTYFYCALAANSMGTALGAVQSFITPSSPTAFTVPATSVTTSSATLNGSGNPNRSSTTGWFRYSTTNPGTCDDKFGSRAPVSGGTYLGSDIYDQPFSQSISGLSGGTTYYYCAIVTSTEGTAFGVVSAFTTSGISTATTNAATSISSTAATLNGAGVPNGGSASGWFRYSTTNPGTCSDSFGTRAPSSTGVSLGAGTSSVNYAQSISGLVAGSTYYYCAIVSNSYGTGFGSIVSFTTPAMAPTVTTSSATSLTMTTGVLTGYGNPGGDATTGWFRFSTASPGTCNNSFGTRAPAMGGSALGSGTSNASFSQAITGLTPATTYYYCALATNSMGTALGAVQTFITPSAPTAFTAAANSLTNTSANLNGSGNPNRASATGWFRYSTTNPGTCDDKFGSRAPLSSGTYLGSDIYDQPFSQSISGLSPATTYYYCAIVASTEGTAFGAMMSFTTATTATATTNAASSVASTSATLSGAGIPNGASATGWFRYSTANPGACNDSFGTRAPSSYGANLGSGSASVNFAQPISGLLPGATYYYCAIVSNTYGTGFGAVISFTTPVMAPTVTTSSATSLTMTTGVLTGYGNPGGDATTGWFRFSTASPGTCNDSFGTRAPAMGGSALGSGTSNTSFSQPITGLAPATTYYYCALAANSVGTALGAVQTFITPSTPTVVTASATSVTTNSANLNGAGNPSRASTVGWFRYSTTNPGACDDKFGSRAPVTSGTYLGSDIYDQPYSQSITGLSPATTYYFCAIVSSTEGTAFGAVMVFTTSAPATATTAAATSAAPTTATLNGSGNPNGASATAWFRYSTTSPGTCNDTFGIRTPSSGGTSLGAGTASVAFGQPITGLLPGVTYYFCALVSNAYGTGMGAVMSFTTPAGPPTVTTDYASGITTNLNGSANPNGAATTGWFRIATSSPGTCNDTFGTRLPATSGTALGAGSGFVAYANPAPGLVPGTTYYYCAIASNSVGTSFGIIRSFTAPMPPTVATLAATPVTATTATLNGSSNPNGNSTIGWFRYSTSSPGTCNDVFGTRAPISSGTSLGSGTASTPFAEPITGLAPATTYYFCAMALSAYGTALGSVLSFTTPPASSIVKPTDPAPIVTTVRKVTTVAASALAADSAVLNGTANPSGVEMTGWFRYSPTAPSTCNDTFGSRAPVNGAAALGSGSAPVDFSQSVTGLLPGTTYYFCAVAAGADGPSFGEVLSLTTRAAPPAVKTNAPTDVLGGTAILNAAIVPKGEATTSWFRYDSTKPDSCNDSFGLRAPVEGGKSLGSGGSTIAHAEPVFGLTRGETYYYCAIATSSLGTSFGEVVSFVAGASAPTVQTESPIVVDSHSAAVAGSVFANGSEVSVWFRYGESDPGVCDDSFGSRVAAKSRTAIGAEFLVRPDGEQLPTTSANYVSEPMNGLKPGFTYYYCVAASNLGGAKFGQVRSFTTAAAPPELGTATTTGTSVEPETLTGCSYTLRAANPSGSLLSLLCFLPLACFLLFRRRKSALSTSRSNQ